MLGLLLIYFVGRYFYVLAEDCKKHKWGYAILGVASYYISVYLLGGLCFAALDHFDVVNIDKLSSLEASLLAIPFGVLGAFLTYKFLERKWKQPVKALSGDILDGGLKRS